MKKAPLFFQESVCCSEFRDADILQGIRVLPMKTEAYPDCFPVNGWMKRGMRAERRFA